LEAHESHDYLASCVFKCWNWWNSLTGDETEMWVAALLPLVENAGFCGAAHSSYAGTPKPSWSKQVYISCYK